MVEEIRMDKDKEINRIAREDPATQQYYKRMCSLPPYQFMLAYIPSMIHGARCEKERHTGIGLMENFGKMVGHDQIRFLEIDETLTPLIENTKNKLFYRPLFFPKVFINNEFKFKHLIIKGIMIQDLNDEGLTFAKENEIFTHAVKDWALVAVAYDEEKMEEFYCAIGLMDRRMTYNIYEFDEDKKIQAEFSEYVRLLAVNIVDMVENNDEDELERITITVTQEHNEKRAKRGKPPMPNKIYIRPKGKLFEYIKAYNEHKENNKIMHKFQVMGHWKHFRDERYTPEVRGTKKWILPFWKGEGIIVNKQHYLKDSVEDEDESEEIKPNKKD